MMHLSMTINHIIVVHIRAKVCGIAAMDDPETRWSKRVKVDEVVVDGSGEEYYSVCFEELANEEQLMR